MVLCWGDIMVFKLLYKFTFSLLVSTTLFAGKVALAIGDEDEHAGYGTTVISTEKSKPVEGSQEAPQAHNAQFLAKLLEGKDFETEEAEKIDKNDERGKMDECLNKALNLSRMLILRQTHQALDMFFGSNIQELKDFLEKKPLPYVAEGGHEVNREINLFSNDEKVDCEIKTKLEAEVEKKVYEREVPPNSHPFLALQKKK